MKFYNNLTKVSEYLLYGLIISVFFSTALMNILLGLIIVCFGIQCFISKKVLYESTILDIPIILLILSKVISIITSVSPYSSTLILYKEMPIYFLFFIINTIVIKDQTEISRNFLRMVLYASFMAALIGIGSYIFIFSERAISTSSGYITLGNLLCISLTMFLFLEEEKYLFRNKLFFIIYILVLLTCILFTFNRLHWIASVLLLIIYSLHKKNYFYIIAVVLIITSILILVPSVQERFFQIIYFWKNMSDRDILWKDALSMIFERPISGFGPNTFSLVFKSREQLADKLVSSWHNEYLQIYMDSGIIGILSLGYLIFTIFRNILKLLKLEIKNRRIIIPQIGAITLLFVFGGFTDYLPSILFVTLLSFFAIQTKLAYNEKNLF